MSQWGRFVHLGTFPFGHFCPFWDTSIKINKVDACDEQSCYHKKYDFFVKCF